MLFAFVSAAGVCPPEAVSITGALFLACRLALFVGAELFFAIAMARTLKPRAETLDMLITSGLFFFMTALLSVPFITRASWTLTVAYPLLLGLAGAALWRFCVMGKPGPERGAPGGFSLPGLAGWTWFCLLAAALLAHALAHPRFEHDPLTYQLHFAASWLQSGSVDIVPAPFGDPSHAYGPAFASLFYLGLMAPLSGDLVAAAGGWWFLAYAAVCAAGIARGLGASRQWSFLPALLLFLSPLSVYEGRTALNDITIGAFLAASVYFLVAAANRKAPLDLALGIAAAGMAAGCKYSAPPFVALLIPLAIYAAAKTGRGRGAGLAPGLLAAGTACWWYFRNLIVAGNPFYPIEVKVFGRALFAGLYDRERMLGWFFHYEGWGKWAEAMLANFTPGLLAVMSLGLVGLVVAAVRPGLFVRCGIAEGSGSMVPGSPPRERVALGLGATGLVARAMLIYMALMPLLMDRIIWRVSPYQEYRFWTAAAPVFCGVAGAALAIRREAGLAALAAGYIGLFLARDPFPDGEVRDWLRLVYPIAGAAALAAGLLVPLALGGRALSRAAKAAALLLPAILAIGFVAFALTGYAERRADALGRFEYAAGWRRAGIVDGGDGPPLRVAYAGANVPYPLFGPGLCNEVMYFSTDGVLVRGHMSEFEDRAREEKFLTPEPQTSRLRHCPRQWALALFDYKADVLFVMKTPRNALLNIAHDRDGWPVEDKWARSAPGVFGLAYRDDFCKVYRISPAALATDAAVFPPGCIERSADAVTACSYGSAQCGALFPLAGAVMQVLDE